MDKNCFREIVEKAARQCTPALSEEQVDQIVRKAEELYDNSPLAPIPAKTVVTKGRTA